MAGKHSYSENNIDEDEDEFLWNDKRGNNRSGRRIRQNTIRQVKNSYQFGELTEEDLDEIFLDNDEFSS